MEIRARYVQMGAFALAVVAAGFAFVFWLNNAGGLSQRAVYYVRFDSPVSGLLRGSAVLFNGIRVGEITRLELNAANPRRVQATIAIDRDTPVRTDTAVGIDFQGLTGSPVIALTGGSSTLPLVAGKGEPATLVADPAAGQSMSQAARDVLRRFDAVLAENAEPLRTMIANLDKFAGALARNSDRLDGIVAGPLLRRRSIRTPAETEAHFPFCKGGVMARNAAWRKSRTAWRATVDGWIERQRPEDLLNVDIFFDAVAVHGEASLAEDIWYYAYERAYVARDFQNLLIEVTRNRQSPFTLFGRLRVDS